MDDSTESLNALTPAKAKNSQNAAAATAHIIASESANANEQPRGFSLANFKALKNELMIQTHNENRAGAGNNKIFRARRKIGKTGASAKKTPKKSGNSLCDGARLQKNIGF